MNADADDIPTRSAAGLAALDVFYEDYNDWHVYVEDEEQENLYHALLSKIFPRIAISRIFPLRGKQAVINHAVATNNEGIAKFRVYVLDKDFDDLLGIQVGHPNIFYLDRYCIENYVTEEDAIVEIVIENLPRKKRSDVAAALKLDDVIESTYESLRPLFTLFFCVQRFDLGIANSKAASEAYCCAGRAWELEPSRVADYATQVKCAALAKGLEPEMADPLTDVRISCAAVAETHAVVSGKFASAMLFHYIKAKYKMGTMTFDSFIFRLAKHCSGTPLQGFAKRVEEAAVEAKKAASGSSVAA